MAGNPNKLYGKDAFRKSNSKTGGNAYSPGEPEYWHAPDLDAQAMREANDKLRRMKMNTYHNRFPTKTKINQA